MLTLGGIKVLDLTQYPPGALCTMILADQGAEVIKIEALSDSPVGSRPGTEGTEAQKRKELAYDALNRNKQSLVLNLKSKEGQEVFHKLASDADVIVESFRPGVVQRLGVDYKAIAKENPRIIYCSLTGYGQEGPYAKLPGHDVGYIAFGGAYGLVGTKDKPIMPLSLIGDFAGAGLEGAISILMALVSRGNTGKGQYIDFAFTDAVIYLMTPFIRYAMMGNPMQRGCGLLAGTYPFYRAYKAKDGKYVSLGCTESWFWENFCRAIGKEEYIPYGFDREKHFLHETKGKKMAEITADLEKLFLTKTRDQWFKLLSDKNVPIAKLLDIEELPSDPQVIEREMIIDIDAPKVGKVKQVGIPFKFSRTKGEVRSLAPMVGEHTDKILTDLGYSKKAVAAMRKAKAVA